MSTAIASCVLIAGLTALLSGCAAAPLSSGQVTYSHCALDSHTEAFPNNQNPKRAYGCRSSQKGFLVPWRDEQRNMRQL
jgi:hypothetical protein